MLVAFYAVVWYHILEEVHQEFGRKSTVTMTLTQPYVQLGWQTSTTREFWKWRDEDFRRFIEQYKNGGERYIRDFELPPPPWTEGYLDKPISSNILWQFVMEMMHGTRGARQHPTAPRDEGNATGRHRR